MDNDSNPLDTRKITKNTVCTDSRDGSDLKHDLTVVHVGLSEPQLQQLHIPNLPTRTYAQHLFVNEMKIFKYVMSRLLESDYSVINVCGVCAEENHLAVL